MHKFNSNQVINDLMQNLLNAILYDKKETTNRKKKKKINRELLLVLVENILLHT